MNEVKILLADDDKDDCIFFREALEELQLNTSLTMVYNGDQLMQQLNDGSMPLPDILFLDLNMPRKSGFSCLTEIRGSDKLKQLPVVIYSTSFDENMADLLYKMGANHYICKPADFSLLKRVIHHAITVTVNEDNFQPSRENFLINTLKEICGEKK